MLTGGQKESERIASGCVCSAQEGSRCDERIGSEEVKEVTGVCIRIFFLSVKLMEVNSSCGGHDAIKDLCRWQSIEF
jgi:hypothetical protein